MYPNFHSYTCARDCPEWTPTASDTLSHVFLEICIYILVIFGYCPLALYALLALVTLAIAF